jgi:hypothetical protein
LQIARRPWAYLLPAPVSLPVAQRSAQPAQLSSQPVLQERISAKSPAPVVRP